jgi:hypothetical protein
MEDPHFLCTAEIREHGSLEIAWAMRNVSAHRLYLVNRLPHFAAYLLTFDTGRPYTETSEDHKEIEVSWRAHELPKAIDIFSPMVPALTILEPDETLEHKQVLALPLEIHSPFKPHLRTADAKDTHVVLMQRLRVRVGYVPSDVEVRMAFDPASGMELRTMDFATLLRQQRLTEESFALRVPVRIGHPPWQ